ncbi:MAG: hypothetical protein ACE5LU_24385, partial [Anaerolineae bacterium]
MRKKAVATLPNATAYHSDISTEGESCPAVRRLHIILAHMFDPVKSSTGTFAQDLATAQSSTARARQLYLALALLLDLDIIALNEPGGIRTHGQRIKSPLL